jgi:ABC-2 type transport system ATP-binding protein
VNAIIEARGLNKRYGTRVALDRVDLNIPAGRIVGLIGPNGAGKTTALKAILGLTPYEGELKVLGRDPYRERTAMLTEVCYIADVAVLPRWAKVSELIRFTEAVHPRFSRARCEELLRATQITPDLKVKQLSRGMVVQLHLALIMAIDAKLLILDEPTLGLDIIFRKRFYEQLVGDYFDGEKTIVITTHQVEEIEHLLSDLIFIDQGRIVLDAPMDSLAERYLELTVPPDRLDAARALKPIAERRLLSGAALLYDGVSNDTLAALGQVRPVGVADLFVALLGHAQSARPLTGGPR